MAARAQTGVLSASGLWGVVLGLWVLWNKRPNARPDEGRAFLF